MDKVAINVNEYYGNASYYSVMPQSVFDLLEAAFLNGLTSVPVDKDVFDKMVADYKNKMAL